MPLAALATRVRPPLDALRQIAANPGLLRLELGSLAWSAADWTYLAGLSVFAYQGAARPPSHLCRSSGRSRRCSWSR